MDGKVTVIPYKTVEVYAPSKEANVWLFAGLAAGVAAIVAATAIILMKKQKRRVN